MTLNTLPQKHTITQFDLARYIKRANQIESLKAEQAVLERDLKLALANGTSVEPGKHLASLKTTARKNVSWKTVVERLRGAGYARKVLAATKPTNYTRLIVS